MTAQIASAINTVLRPQGVGVVLKAEHFCMTARGIMKPGTDLVTCLLYTSDAADE